MPNQSELEVIQVPVNLNGSLSVRVPKNMHRVEVERLAIERFSARISNPFHIGENAESHARFEGEAWGEVGNAKVGNLEFEVRHDSKTGVSGAMVALAPAPGSFGASSLRARVTAYVSTNAVFVTARSPQNDDERVMVAIQIVEGELTAFLMDPESANAEGESNSSDVYMRYPNLVSRVN